MEINKTSAQKLDNNVQVAQATTTKPAVKTAEGTLSRSTDKISIEDRVAKGKVFVKTKDDFEVYINNTQN